jgi:lactoylglutathione lyase|tara:strand:+ start:762 stop:1151 length:390 start_codon:yes stop_codon:yes gene_type:complete
MKIDRTGIILYTIEHKKCVDFYQNVVGLKELFSTESLTCFEFGDSYLMVEIDDEFCGVQTKEKRIRTCLRMNVSDVKKIAYKLIRNNIEVDYQEHSWGIVAKFFDPDGNLCAFKDSEKFEKQIEKNKMK